MQFFFFYLLICAFVGEENSLGQVCDCAWNTGYILRAFLCIRGRESIRLEIDSLIEYVFSDTLVVATQLAMLGIVVDQSSCVARTVYILFVAILYEGYIVSRNWQCATRAFNSRLC